MPARGNAPVAGKTCTPLGHANDLCFRCGRLDLGEACFGAVVGDDDLEPVTRQRLGFEVSDARP